MYTFDSVLSTDRDFVCVCPVTAASHIITPFESTFLIIEYEGNGEYTILYYLAFLF